MAKQQAPAPYEIKRLWLLNGSKKPITAKTIRFFDTVEEVEAYRAKLIKKFKHEVVFFVKGPEWFTQSPHPESYAPIPKEDALAGG